MSTAIIFIGYNKCYILIPKNKIGSHSLPASADSTSTGRNPHTTRTQHSDPSGATASHSPATTTTNHASASSYPRSSTATTLSSWSQSDNHLGKTLATAATQSGHRTPATASLQASVSHNRTLAAL